MKFNYFQKTSQLWRYVGAESFLISDWNFHTSMISQTLNAIWSYSRGPKLFNSSLSNSRKNVYFKVKWIAMINSLVISKYFLVVNFSSTLVCVFPRTLTCRIILVHYKSCRVIDIQLHWKTFQFQFSTILNSQTHLHT